jgi:hypothetical protein
MRKTVPKSKQDKSVAPRKDKRQSRRKPRWNERAVIHQGIYYEPGELEKI